MIVAATGHRPDKLGGYDQKTRRALGALAVEHLSLNRPEKVISGMALGWDQAVASACVALGIPFIAAVPFLGQEGRWPEVAQQRYRRLLGQAEEIVIVANLFDPTLTALRALEMRNRWMVDRADLMLALWDGSFGGTCNCLDYARKKGVPFDNLWDKWSLDEEIREMLG